MTIKVLLQTTIAPAADNWSIDRFSLLATLLRQERDESGHAVFEVRTRDRDPLGAPDTLDEPPGDGILRSSEARAAAGRYARNVARWLAGLPTD